jgi:hypothetical protein
MTLRLGFQHRSTGRSRYSPGGPLWRSRLDCRSRVGAPVSARSHRSYDAPSRRTAFWPSGARIAVRPHPQARAEPSEIKQKIHDALWRNAHLRSRLMGAKSLSKRPFGHGSNGRSRARALILLPSNCFVAPARFSWMKHCEAALSSQVT